jgi:hypothetical protein
METMTMTTNLPDIATLDADALRWELAERLGWHTVIRGIEGVGLVHQWVSPTGEENPDWETIPFYWSTDVGDALALCLEIAKRHFWKVMVDDDSAWFVEQEIVYDTHVVYAPEYDADGDTPALALARLALAALRAGA